MHITMPSQAYLKELFDYDPNTGHLIYKKARAGISVGARAGSIDSWGHRQVKIDGKIYQAHRIIWLWWYGDLPICQIDHINRIKDDNSIYNLRLALRNDYDNQQNVGLRKNNSSGVRGVCWLARSNSWQVQIQAGKKKIHVGLFSCLLDAVAARLAAERKYYTFLHQ